MRKQLGLMIGLSVIGGIALPASGGGAAAVSMEKSLLSIRILQSYKKVLARYGQPNRIYQRNEAFDFIPAVDSKGNPTGGVKGLADMEQPGGTGANTASSSPSGFGGASMGGFGGGKVMLSPTGAGNAGGGKMGGMMGMGAPMSSGPTMSGYGGMMGMGGRPAGSMGGMMPGSMGGRPSGSMGAMAGMMGSMGGMMPGAMPGAGSMSPTGTASQNQGTGYAASGGYVWVYLFPTKELAYTFHFNKDGRVEMIGEFGRRLGVPTSKNVKLGDPVKSVYATYGYPDNMLQQGDVLTLLYNQKHHAQFDIQNNKVTGIAIFLHEVQRFERGAAGGAGGSATGRVAGGMAGALAPGGGRGGEIRGTGGGGRPGGAGID